MQQPLYATPQYALAKLKLAYNNRTVIGSNKANYIFNTKKNGSMFLVSCINIMKSSKYNIKNKTLKQL